MLTVNPRAYPQIGHDQMSDIPSDIMVKRAFGLDASRHLSFKGIFPDFLNLPDRWSTWWLGAVLSGMRLIRREKPKLIWSTYPIATAHLIGLTLSKLSGLPWVADFRDSMTEEHYPSNPRQRSVYQWIERKTVHRAAKVVFTTPGTVKMYQDRYPALDMDKFRCITNGYDEENFQNAEKNYGNTQNNNNKVKTTIELVHSGILYPSERDPRKFFEALARIQTQSPAKVTNLRVTLRATAHDEIINGLIQEYGIERIVKLMPSIPYEEALKEMLGADGLLIFQATNCNHQIPAKLYEYLRARRPILALTDPSGDTAGTLLNENIHSIAALDNAEEIEKVLIKFLEEVTHNTYKLPNENAIKKYSRRSQAYELSELFDKLVLGS